MSKKLVLPFLLASCLLSGILSAADDVLVEDLVGASDALVPLSADELLKNIAQEEGEIASLEDAVPDEDPAQLVLQSFEGVYDVAEPEASEQAVENDPEPISSVVELPVRAEEPLLQEREQMLESEEDSAELIKVQDQEVIRESEMLSSATPSVPFVKRTPLENRLLRAVMENRGRLVRDILKNPRVNVNITDDTGKTPLMLAVLFGRPGIVKEILKHNPDLTVLNYDHKTALDMARGQCNKKLIKLLQHAATKSPTCI
jgi:hypothetical protein